jgi:hypothetical protein
MYAYELGRGLRHKFQIPGYPGIVFCRGSWVNQLLHGSSQLAKLKFPATRACPDVSNLSTLIQKQLKPNLVANSLNWPKASMHSWKSWTLAEWQICRSLFFDYPVQMSEGMQALNPCLPKESFSCVRRFSSCIVCILWYLFMYLWLKLWRCVTLFCLDSYSDPGTSVAPGRVIIRPSQDLPGYPGPRVWHIWSCLRIVICIYEESLCIQVTEKNFGWYNCRLKMYGFDGVLYWVSSLHFCHEQARDRSDTDKRNDHRITEFLKWAF